MKTVVYKGVPNPIHDAEYFRRRRRAQGIRQRDSFSAQGLIQRGAELRRLEQQPWPRSLFSGSPPVATLLDVTAQLSERAGEDPDNQCPCGCRRAHKHNVAQTVRNPYGRGFDVMYFWSEACKRKWNQERTPRPPSAV
jgi:hypothetical protein